MSLFADGHTTVLSSGELDRRFYPTRPTHTGTEGAGKQRPFVSLGQTRREPKVRPLADGKSRMRPFVSWR
jgi:hypothetical protein